MTILISGKEDFTASTRDEKGHYRTMKTKQDLPGGPVVKTSPSNAGGVGLVSSLGATIPRASQPKSKKHKNRSNIVTNSIKTF